VKREKLSGTSKFWDKKKPAFAGFVGDTRLALVSSPVGGLLFVY